MALSLKGFALTALQGIKNTKSSAKKAKFLTRLKNF